MRRNAGLFYGGGIAQLGKQAVGVVAVMVYSFVVAYLIGFAIEKTIGFRVKAEAEVEGIDIAEHAESAYDLSPTSGSSGGAFAMAGIAPSTPAGTATGADSTAEASTPVSDKVAG